MKYKIKFFIINLKFKFMNILKIIYIYIKFYKYNLKIIYDTIISIMHK